MSLFNIFNKKAQARQVQQSMEEFGKKIGRLRCQLNGFNFSNEIKNVLISEQVMDWTTLQKNQTKSNFLFFLNRMKVYRRSRIYIKNKSVLIDLRDF
jgi:hypothetical protein